MIDLKQQVLDFLSSREDPVKLKRIEKILGLEPSDRPMLRELLAEMVKAGKLVRDGVRYWVPMGKQVSLEIKRQKTRSGNQLTGRISINRKGDGFVANPRGTDWLVPSKYLGGARQGDVVQAQRVEMGRGGRIIAEVCAIESYGTEVALGIFEGHGVDTWFTPFGDLRLERSALLDFPKDVPPDAVGRFNREGDGKWRFAGILGDMNDPRVDEAIVLAEGNIETEFPKDVLAECEAFSDFQFDAEGREDFRDRQVFTVDGETARDFDDALHFMPLEGGLVEVGIHIADVAEYVKPGSALDLEARKRGNSVYLPHKAIPMLPERLSTDLCSLNPGVPRYTLSVVAVLTNTGEVKSFKICKGLIESAFRLTYTLVEAMAVDKDEAVREEYAAVLDSVELGLNLSRRMKERRFAQGGLKLDMAETRAVLGEDQLIKEMAIVHQTDANRMIEAFMCLANECVAHHMSDNGISIPYRIHDTPSPEKLEILSNFWAARGLDVPFRLATLPGPSINHMIESLEENSQTEILQLQVLKSLKLAEYNTENRGHFGLASSFYAHYTSPIRRYADLIIHQRITHMLRLKDPGPEHFDDSDLESICSHISARERVAQRAEQTFMQLKQLRLMLDKVGEVFDGFIMDVKAFGIFVRMDPWNVTGMILIDSLTDDFYEINPESLALVGTRTGKSLRVGDPLRVRVDMVDVLTRRINLSPEKMPDRRGAKNKPPRRNPKTKIKRFPGPPKKRRRR